MVLDILTYGLVGAFIGLSICAIDLTYRGHLQKKRFEAQENRWKKEREQDEKNKVKRTR